MKLTKSSLVIFLTLLVTAPFTYATVEKSAATGLPPDPTLTEDIDGPAMDDHSATVGIIEKETAPTGGTTAPTPAMTVKNVETLMDDPEGYSNKHVSVRGEVRRQVDSRVFILEGGGIINDKIAVLTRSDLPPRLHAGQEVRVKGLVRAVPYDTIKSEANWPIPAAKESELQKYKAFLIADEIAIVQR